MLAIAPVRTGKRASTEIGNGAPTIAPTSGVRGVKSQVILTTLSSPRLVPLG